MASSISNYLRAAGHVVINEAIGPEAVKAENNAKNAISLLKIIGLAALVAGAILTASSLASALWVSATLGLIPVIVGHDMLVASNNAETQLESLAGRISIINNYNNRNYKELFNSISNGTFIKVILLSFKDSNLK